MGDHTATQPATATDQPVLTLETLARLMENVRQGEWFEMQPVLDVLIQAHPEAAKLAAQLPTVIADCGYECLDGAAAAASAASVARQLDQLVEAGDWGDAVHVLPDEDLIDGEPVYEDLLRMCEARIRRGAGDPERLVQVRGKLERGFLAQQRRWRELPPFDVAA